MDIFVLISFFVNISKVGCIVGPLLMESVCDWPLRVSQNNSSLTSSLNGRQITKSEHHHGSHHFVSKHYMDYKEFSYYTAMGSSRNLKNNQDDVDYLFELLVLFRIDWFVSLT